MNSASSSSKDLYIRSGSGEFLIYKTQEQGDGVQVRYSNETLWMTQSAMAELFDIQKAAVSKHLSNIYADGELDKSATVSKMETVQVEGERRVARKLDFYNLDAIISVGYRVNSKRATQFRRWATQVLRQFMIKGYVIDKERMEQGQFLGKDYFEELLEEIREIRLSERRFYQKVTDLFATSVDYDAQSPIAREFFARVQNKMHYAVSHQTAPEIIYNRANANDKNMGLTSWKNSPNGKILRTDVTIAKNYLGKDEIKDLGLIISAFLDMAESRAKRRIPMTMQDWAEQIDKFLELDERGILQNAGSISREIANNKALSEFEKYRVMQDRLYKSDFDKMIGDDNE